MNSKLRIPIILVVIIIIIDQVLKFWIKTNLKLNDVIPLFGNWGFILFTENPGMAFGYKFGGEAGKIALTIFRMVAVVGITWYLIDLAKKNAPKGLLLSFALILAGAVGNIFDSAFYGLIFSDSVGQVAQLFPAGGGYGKFLRGEVVDMFYFPIVEGHYPSWFPFWANESFTFFRPVFNLADSSITMGVATILIFHRKFFKNAGKEPLETKRENPTEIVNS
jgi:signal peptidase II